MTATTISIDGWAWDDRRLAYVNGDFAIAGDDVDNDEDAFAWYTEVAQMMADGEDVARWNTGVYRLSAQS